MDEAANFFRGFTRESRFPATFADLRGNVFDKDSTAINGKHLAHKLAFCGTATADMTLKHGHLRFR
jgi:hypothetical protein